MRETYGLVARFTIKPGCESTFDELAAAVLDQVRASEPDTLVYACHSVDGDAQGRVFYEVYADEAAFRHHEAQEHTRRFLDARGPLLERTDVAFLHLTDAKGLAGA